MQEYSATVRQITSVILIGSGLVLPTAGLADAFEIRVAFANVPGTDQLESGDIAGGIRILEERQVDRLAPKYIDEMATLCAAYVVNNEFDEAEAPCNFSVRKFRTMISYVNRGALRANLGDFEAARQDFDYARSIEEPRYLSEDQADYVRQLADHNFSLVNELIARRDQPEIEGGLALTDSN